jgi:NADH:ubiquinone oxidoreductase subunit E
MFHQGGAMSELFDNTKLEKILEMHSGQKGALIPILQEIQAAYGYLPEEALKMVSRRVKVPLSRIYGVITFYAQFYLTPRGKHLIKACQGTACHVRGASQVLDNLSRELKVNPGGTTEDLSFSLETVACVGTCFLAPVIMINEDYYGKLTPKKAMDAVKKYFEKAAKEEG